MFRDGWSNFFSTIVADPPWELTRAGGWNTNKNHRKLEYKTMPISEIRRLPVSDISAEISYLFLWVVNSHVEDSYAICREWGFRPVTLLVWCKKPIGIGPGGMFSTTTEFCLYGRRGSSKTGREKAEPSSWFNWPRTKRHSEKPKEFYDLVESRFPSPRIDLFAREKRLGWESWGDEV